MGTDYVANKLVVYLTVRRNMCRMGDTERVLGASRLRYAPVIRLAKYLTDRLMKEIEYTNLDNDVLERQHIEQEYPTEKIRSSADGSLMVYGQYAWRVIEMELDGELLK